VIVTVRLLIPDGLHDLLTTPPDDHLLNTRNTWFGRSQDRKYQGRVPARRQRVEMAGVRPSEVVVSL
jgi:hypothetical protein